MRKMKGVAITAALLALAGCAPPTWLDVNMVWLDQDSQYLGQDPIVLDNQQLRYGEDVAAMEISALFRLNDGATKLSYITVTIVYEDGFDPIFEQSYTAVPVVVSVPLRDANGKPYYDVLHVKVDAVYTRHGPYHDDAALPEQVNCTLKPAELTSEGEGEGEGEVKANWDWGGASASAPDEYQRQEKPAIAGEDQTS